MGSSVLAPPLPHSCPCPTDLQAMEKSIKIDQSLQRFLRIEERVGTGLKLQDGRTARKLSVGVGTVKLKITLRYRLSPTPLQTRLQFLKTKNILPSVSYSIKFPSHLLGRSQLISISILQKWARIGSQQAHKSLVPVPDSSVLRIYRPAVPFPSSSQVLTSPEDPPSGWSLSRLCRARSSH